jgi:hypothetical protein
MQFFGEALLVLVVLEAAFVDEHWIPRVGVQRVELIHVLIGPGEKGDRMAPQIGGEGA